MFFRNVILVFIFISSDGGILVLGILNIFKTFFLIWLMKNVICKYNRLDI